MSYVLLHTGQGSAERLARKVGNVVTVRDVRTIGADDVVIRYGNARDPDAGFWTVNRRQAMRCAENPDVMRKMLRRAGVQSLKPGFGNGRIQLNRHYRIPVFGLKAQGCFRTDDKTVWLHQRINQVQDSFQEVQVDTDEQARRVCLLAVRAIHALGLECGLVSIGINPHGRLLVLDVSPSPVLRGRMLELYATGLQEYMDNLERSRQVTDTTLLMGTDLEFMLRTQEGKMMVASRFFPAKGSVGCDARTFAGDRSKRPLAELRPEPARTPEELCHNIETTLRQAMTMAKREYPQWVAGSSPFERFTLGGHIHFSGIPYTGRLVELLDAYVGLPLMLIEDPTTARRRRPKYGFLGDVRHKAYGGFEYRTPASFLVDPDITLGALALAYLVAMHQSTLPYLPLHTPDNARAFYHSDRDRLLGLALDAKEHLSHTPTYSRYRDVIDPIFDMIAKDEVWDETIDIRTAWGLPLTQTKERKSRKGQHRAS